MRYEVVGNTILVNDEEFISSHLQYDNSHILKQLIDLKIEYEITYKMRKVE